MHTVIRHTKTTDGFACVISGYGGKPTAVQEYAQTPSEGPHTSLVSERYFDDERDAIAWFEHVWMSPPLEDLWDNASLGTGQGDPKYWVEEIEIKGLT